MYGDLANKLILEAKRTYQLTEVPLYQHELIKNIIQEMSDLHKDIEYLNDQQNFESQDIENSQRINQCQLFVTHLCLRRNKRCLLAYSKLRARKICEFSWLNIDPIQNFNNQDVKFGNSRPRFSPSVNGSKRLEIENLSHPEQEYLKHYQDLLLDYKSGFSDIDISGELEPPSEIFIDVRVLKNGGEVQTEYGVFNLIKDSQFYVRKSDVERLIQQGFLEEI